MKKQTAVSPTAERQIRRAYLGLLLAIGERAEADGELDVFLRNWITPDLRELLARVCRGRPDCSVQVAAPPARPDRRLKKPR